MTEGLVRARVEDGVAVLRLRQPPTNVLNRALCVALEEAVDHFLADTGIVGLVIGAEGGVFSAGLDLRELSPGAGSDPLPGLCQKIENADKTIVAALPGAALGRGAELALSAHYRVGRREIKFGLPDAQLGLLPGAGGTQRLPRVVGPKVAIQMLQSGRAVDEMVAQRIGLVDQLVHADELGAAARLARTRAPRRTSVLRDHFADGTAYMQAVADARKGAGKLYVADRIVDCVEAALLLPAETAMAYEQEAAAECFAHRESRGLRHVFVAERRTAPKLTVDRKPTPKGQSIVARLYAAQDRAIVALVRAGTTESEVDGALVALGFAAGPFGGREPVPGPVSQSLQRRIIAAIMAEGARCLEQGLVERASDLDVLAVHAMGFPREWGGPMKAAELMGLLGLSRQMQGWAREDAVWQAPALLGKAVLQADGFAGLS